MKQKIKELFIIFISICIYCIWMRLLHITCPIKWLTGISCPGCGMTRAWIQILQGHIGSACYYHPLWWIPPIFLIVYLFKSKIKEKTYKRILYVFIGFFICAYLYRFTLEQDIVVFAPQQSIIYLGFLRLRQVLHL